MALSTMWIRCNMLGSPIQCESRKFTEAELKVQRSLQKLSIPDWYLNKRSSPPKILSNVTPIESRPPSWKNPRVKKESAVPSANSGTARNADLIKTTGDSGTYKVTRQSRSPEAKHRKSPSKSASKDQLLDTNIPNVKLSTNISRTFPKVSPCRKIQHINIVFPPGPKIENMIGLDDDKPAPKYSTFVKKQLFEDTDAKEPENSSNDTIDSSADLLKISFQTPKAKGDFKVRAVSTPKCSPAPNLFSSTVVEKSPQPSLISKSLDFESSPQKLSQSFLSMSKPESSRKANRTLTLERNIRSIDPILFEKDDPITKPAPAKTSADDFPSPCTRFLYSRRKSTELEKVVQSTLPRGKSVIKAIIQELNKKSNFTLTRKSSITVRSPNFVKNMVNALEKGGTLKLGQSQVRQKSVSEDESTESSSESVKSGASTTSMSAKDTDSSDSDQRSPLRSDSETTFNYEILTTRKFVDERRANQSEDDDSVYWIPVSTCKLPRTSSLLSMMSKLSTGRQSPCLSPIRSDSDDSQNGVWGVTFRKSPSPLQKKLFRIDETAITDSGYSDRSEKSENYSASIIDGTWSEDTQIDSGSESTTFRSRKSSFRRKSIVGLRSSLV